LPGTRTVTDPVGTHSDAAFPSEDGTPRHYRRDDADKYEVVRYPSVIPPLGTSFSNTEGLPR
jgi:hypothetical protein